MKIDILSLIDFERVNILLEGFNKTTEFVTAILDLKGNVLSKSGWRQICTDFHRIHPECSKRCTVSDTVLAGEVGDGEKYHFYICLNGLVDVAVPIVINGEHVANLFSGQFFFDEPDRVFFRKQAVQFGFNEDKYIDALEKVPVVSKEKVKLAIEFLLNMTQMISEMTFQRLEQIHLNEALKKSEERTRSVLDNMLEGCQIIGFDWKYLYLNYAAELHNRRPNSELIGNRYTDMWPGIENTEVFKTIKKVLENRVTDHIVNEFVFPDGNKGWFDLSIQPVPEGVFILSIDITETKKSEELLYESEFRFIKLYENGPLGMVMVNNDFKIRKANAEYCRLLGYTEAELQGLTFKDVSHPDDLGIDMPYVKKLIAGEISVYKTEKRYVRKDGQVVWASLTIIPTKDRDGKFLYNIAIVEDINHRKSVEEDIKRLNERITTATKASQVGIWDWDIKNKKLLWDDQMLAVYSLDKSTFIIEIDSWYNSIYPDDREFCHDQISMALSGEKDYDAEYRIVWPDGTIRFSKAKGEVLRDENGKPTRMVGINFDITEQKKKDEKIREKDQEFRKLSANVPGLIFQFIRKPDGNYCVPIASEGIKNIFGCTPEDVLENFDAIGRVLHPDDAVRVLADIEYSAEHLTNFTCEFRVQIPGRDVQWIYSLSTPERLPDGTIVWYGFNTDITDRKNAEKALEESEKRFKQVAENAREWIWEVDDNGLYTYSSPVIKSLLGYSEDELVGKKHFYDLFLPEKREELISTALDIFNNKETFKNFENQNVHKDGRVLTLTTSGSPFYDDNGIFLGYRGVDTDFTERTKMLQELIYAKEKAEESDKLKTAFINNISHEIRTPLNGILGFGQLLSESDLTIELRKEYYSIVEKSSNRLINTVSDYLDMARLVTGAMEVNKKNFPIRSLIENVKENTEVLCEEKKLGFEAVIPSEHVDLVLDSDIEIINKTFHILLDNALKYTKQGQISFGYSLIPDFVEFFVNDTGIGIESDNLETIFVMFSQEDPSNTRGYEGSGLGLTIAKGLIKLLGGTISVKSEKGKGSSFTFTIPYNSSSFTEKFLNEKSADIAKRQKPLVLIAEDEELNFMYLEVIMKMIDCDYIHAINGAEAVEICKENSDITLVLMDIKMPVMNGLEATKHIHKFNPELPIIATTAYAQTGSENKFLAAGCNGYLAKPIKKDDLLKMIEKYIIL